MEASEGRRECYRIGDLYLDVGAVQLRRGGEEISLPPLSFRLLVNLARTAPDMASQKELLRSTWGDVIVSEETLKQRVKLLRDALGDDSSRPRYVATVRGRGYKLIPLPVPVDGSAHGARRVAPPPADPSDARGRTDGWVRRIPGGWVGVTVAVIVITAVLGIILMVRGSDSAANGSVLREGHSLAPHSTAVTLVCPGTPAGESRRV